MRTSKHARVKHVLAIIVRDRPELEDKTIILTNGPRVPGDTLNLRFRIGPSHFGHGYPILSSSSFASRQAISSSSSSQSNVSQF